MIYSIRRFSNVEYDLIVNKLKNMVSIWYFFTFLSFQSVFYTFVKFKKFVVFLNFYLLLKTTFFGDFNKTKLR